VGEQPERVPEREAERLHEENSVVLFSRSHPAAASAVRKLDLR
jgi:hypothetical protein